MYPFLTDAQASSPDEIAKNAARIKSLESKYDISFPDELKTYYTHYDGKKIKLCTFQVGNAEYEVSKIVPVGGDGLTFEKIVDNDREDGFISCEFYPLASNRGGDLYYWELGSKNIFLIYGDDVEHPHYICQNISDFFELLSNCFR